MRLRRAASGRGEGARGAGGQRVPPAVATECVGPGGAGWPRALMGRKWLSPRAAPSPGTLRAAVPHHVGKGKVKPSEKKTQTKPKNHLQCWGCFCRVALWCRVAPLSLPLLSEAIDPEERSKGGFFPGRVTAQSWREELLRIRVRALGSEVGRGGLRWART